MVAPPQEEQQPKQHTEIDSLETRPSLSFLKPKRTTKEDSSSLIVIYGTIFSIFLHSAQPTYKLRKIASLKYVTIWLQSEPTEKSSLILIKIIDFFYTWRYPICFGDKQIPTFFWAWCLKLLAKRSKFRLMNFLHAKGRISARLLIRL